MAWESNFYSYICHAQKKIHPIAISLRIHIQELILGFVLVPIVAAQHTHIEQRQNSTHLNFTDFTAMQLPFLSKAVRTIGLMTMLAAIEGMSMVQTAQAQAIPAGKPGSVCTDAYFANPDYMYNPVTEQQRQAISKFGGNPARIKRMNGIWARSSTFSVALDAPVGYVAKKVNGKPVATSAKLVKEMYDTAVNANRDPKATRRRVAELNKKYAEYATFGQQINLMFSPEQIKENTKMIRESSALVVSVMTPAQKQAERDMVRVSAKQMGMCPALSNPARMTYVTLEVGRRPDLDLRLREDKTGATFFK